MAVEIAAEAVAFVVVALFIIVAAFAARRLIIEDIMVFLSNVLLQCSVVYGLLGIDVGIDCSFSNIVLLRQPSQAKVITVLIIIYLERV